MLNSIKAKRNKKINNQDQDSETQEIIDNDNNKKINTPFITILMPAYDESNVIGNTIEQILKVDYPSNRFEILVGTYKSDLKTRDIVNRLANKYNNVREAINLEKPTTKAQNINNAYKYIDNKTDIIGVHDAEDGTSINILKNIAIRNNNNNGNSDVVMNNMQNMKNNIAIKNNDKHYMTQTKIIVDIDNKSTLSEIASAVNFSRYYNIIIPGKERLGFLIFSAGTGTYFEKNLLDKFISLDGFFLDEHNLVEDFEFSMRMAMHNYKTIYESESYVHEKFPNSFTSAIRQRSRWSLGSIQTLMKHGLPKEFSFREKIGLILDYIGLSSPIWIIAFLISIICIVAPLGGVKFIQINSITWYISIINTVVSTEKIIATPYFVLKDTKDSDKIKLKYLRIILATFLNDFINCVAVSKAIYSYMRKNLVWEKTKH